MKPVLKVLVLSAMVAVLSGCCAVGDCCRNSCVRPANWCWGDQCSVATPTSAVNPPPVAPAVVVRR